MQFAKATKFNRKSGEAEGSAVPRTIPGNIFRRSGTSFARVPPGKTDARMLLSGMIMEG
jgi:hypothetical protein